MTPLKETRWLCREQFRSFKRTRNKNYVIRNTTGFCGLQQRLKDVKVLDRVEKIISHTIVFFYKFLKLFHHQTTFYLKVDKLSHNNFTTSLRIGAFERKMGTPKQDGRF